MAQFIAVPSKQHVIVTASMVHWGVFSMNIANAHLQLILCSSYTGAQQVSTRAVRQLVYGTESRRDHNTSSFYSRPSQPLQPQNENYQPNFESYPNSPEVPLQNENWQPGQVLPISTCLPWQNTTPLQSIVQQLQGTVERKFDQFMQRFDSLEDRVTNIGKKNVINFKHYMQHHHHQHQKALLKEVETGIAHLNFRFVSIIMLSGCSNEIIDYYFSLRSEGYMLLFRRESAHS